MVHVGLSFDLFNVISFIYQLYKQAMGYELDLISLQEASHVHNGFAQTFGGTVFRYWNFENLATGFGAC